MKGSMGETIVMVIRSAIAQARSRVWEKDTKFHQRRHIALDDVSPDTTPDDLSELNNP